MANISLKEEFEMSAANIDAIFTSYADLHGVYSDSIKYFKKQLADIPEQYVSKVANREKVFENMSKTVVVKQRAISSQLYSQGLVLLMGNAESILSNMFEMLIISNFRKIKLKKSKSIGFTLQEVIEAKGDGHLGLMLLEKLKGEKNPSEKLSFQNMQQLQGILKGYFGINVGDEFVKELHEYWQVRHIIIHKQGFIDERFVRNLKAANIETKKYKLYSRVALTKEDYRNCFGALVLMFEQIDNELDRLKLEYSIPF